MQNKFGKTYHLTAEDFDSAIVDCANTRHIRENEDYSAAAKAIFGFYIKEEEEINAGAFYINDFIKAIMKLNAPDIEWDQFKYGIIVGGGMLRWLSALGYVTEYFERTNNVSKTKKMLKWMAENSVAGCCGSDYLARFLRTFNDDVKGERVEATKLYAINVLRATVAHEMGHVCLGHLVGEKDSNSITRNNERSADLFASTLLQSMLTGATGAVCAAMVFVSFTWLDKSKKPRNFDDHPDSRERIRNYIESFNALLIGSKITTSMLMKLCR